MAEGGLTEDYRCGYCWQEFGLMTDPRELPCRHVFCMTCLQADYRENDSISCTICQNLCESTDFESLPKVTLDVASEITKTNLTCDFDDCEDQIAVIYCERCQDKICATHQQVHNSFYGKRHKVIAIDVYEQSHSKYKKVVCEDHNEVLDKACEECDTLVCVECDIYDKQCTGLTPHKFASFSSLKKGLTSHFNKLLESATSKLTEMCKLDKQTWRYLDAEEEKCKTMTEEIRNIRDQQITLITEESEELMQKVYEYQKELANKVEVFDSELMAKKDQLELLRSRVHKLKKDGHFTEKVKQKQTIAAEMKRNTEAELGSCELSKIALIATGKNHLRFDLLNIPAQLDFRSVTKIKEAACYSANHREDGSILLGCQNGVQILKQDGKLTRFATDEDIVVSVIEHNRNIYLLCCVDKTCTVYMCLPADLTLRRKLFQFESTDYTVPDFAVSDIYAAVVESADNKLILYDFASKQTKTINLELKLYSIYFLPDGDLLAVHGLGELMRYTIQNAELTVVWKSSMLLNLWKAYSGSTGLLYCTTFKERKIYILSYEGVKLHELRSDRLPNVMGTISINGDELAVPGWDDNEVVLFQMTY